MDKPLETQNLPGMNHEEIENMNRSITSKEIKNVIKNSERRKTLDLMASRVNFTQYLKNS